MLRSTVTVAVCASSLLAVAHVGDCRAYLVGRTEVLQLTTDQTLAPARSRPLGLDDAVLQLGGGCLRPPDPQVRRVRLLTGDRLVLATDGLWRHLDQVALVKTRMLMPADACAALLDGVPAIDEEASVVIVDFSEGSAQEGSADAPDVSALPGQ